MKPKKLYDLEVAEISLVPEGANQKKFLIYKSAGKKMGDLHDKIKNADPDMMKRVDECMKSVKKDGEEGVLGEQEQAAVKAVVRILAPFKDKLSPELIHRVVDEAGYKLEEQSEGEEEGQEEQEEDDGDDVNKSVEDEEEEENEEEDDGFMDEDGEEDEEGIEKDASFSPEKIISQKDDFIPEGVEKEDHMQAKQVADKAYEAHLQKMGYQKYPTKPDVQKQVQKTKGEPVAKSKKQPASLDLTGINPKTKAQVEMIFKSNKELIQKTKELESELLSQKIATRKKEIIQKAKEFSNVAIPEEDMVSQLMEADALGSESYERVCKMFRTLNEQAKSSSLFSEYGTRNQSTGADGSAWGKIEALASSVVQKSSTKMSHADAITQVLETPEGQRLYAEYKNGRKDGI